MASESQDKIPAAYISWKTLAGFIQTYHGAGLPARIDPSILRTMSGTQRSQFMSALRFLKLVTGDGAPTDAFEQLVQAYDTGSWKPELEKALLPAYAEIVANLDLKKATPGMIRERFRSFGAVEGDTTEKAIRFFLNLLREAGIEFSETLQLRERTPRATRRRAPRVKSGSVKGEDDDEARREAPEGTFELPFDVIGREGVVFLSKDITEDEWERISQYVKTVIGFRAQGGSNDAE